MRDFTVLHLRKEDNMFGLSYQEIVLIAVFLLPLTLFAAGLVLLAAYTGYLCIRDFFTHTVHLRHRKAH